LVKKKKRRGGLEVSPLAAHKQKGKLLQPPMNQIGGLLLSSWVNEVLPEMLWTTLLLNSLPRKDCFEKFEVMLTYVSEHIEAFDKKKLDISGFSALDQATFDGLFKSLCQEEAAKKALAPMMLFDSLPGKEKWAALIDVPEESEGDCVAGAIGLAYDHQSTAATDCRWLRVMTENAKGRLHFAGHLQKMFGGLVNYPSNPDPQSVGSSLRALEMATRAIVEGEARTSWEDDFWKECWDRSDCVLPKESDLKFTSHKDKSDQVHKIYTEVIAHYHKCLQTTGVEARQEGAFGLVLYILHLTTLALKSTVGQTLQGRLTLRGAVEALVILKFLSKKDDPTVWMQYRNYGASQAKLAYLKYNEEDAPAFVTKDLLKDLANADVWMEFQDIKLGAWADKNLRQMAIEGDAKDFYDKYYDTLSGYIHANWSAVSHSTFALCVNPLHRFHQVPVEPQFFFEDAVSDLLKVSNLALDQLNTLYPVFKSRLKSP
jgi:uncharacterized protein DUF5677